MRQRALWGLCLLVCIVPTSATAENFLILIMDDVGIDALEPFGRASDYPATPTISAIASVGLVFNNAWSNPICAATRASLQTGRHAHHTGIGRAAIPAGELGLSLDEWTLPEMLASAGYSSAAFDKWGISDPLNAVAPNQHGWDHYDGSLSGVRGGAGETYDHWLRTTDGVQEMHDGYLTEAMFESMTAWIEQASEPWIAYMATFAAHRPFHAPPDHLHSQELEGLDPEVDPRPFFLASIEAIDTLLGQALLAMDPDTLADTTLIILGDNGTTDDVCAPGFPADHDKGTLFEGGINIPLLIAGYRVPDPAVSDALVHVVDLYPTLLEIVGAELPPEIALDGVSILPILEDSSATVQEMVYTERFWPNLVDVDFDPRVHIRAARDSQGYKVIRSNDEEEFYDLARDPLEQKNLFNRPAGLRPREVVALEALHQYLELTEPVVWPLRN